MPRTQRLIGAHRTLYKNSFVNRCLFSFTGVCTLCAPYQLWTLLLHVLLLLYDCSICVLCVLFMFGVRLWHNSKRLFTYFIRNLPSELNLSRHLISSTSDQGTDNYGVRNCKKHYDAVYHVSINVSHKIQLETCKLIEHGFTSAPTQYRLYGRRFLQVCQSTEGGWLVIQTGLSLTRLTSPCYNTTPCMQILYKKII